MAYHEILRLYVLRTWFVTSIPHRKCTYLELSPTKKNSWYIKQSTTSKKDYCALKSLCNIYEQIMYLSNFKKWGGLKRECVMNNFLELIVQRINWFWSCVKLDNETEYHLQKIQELVQSSWRCYTKNMNKYIQEDYMDFIFEVHISHMDYEHYSHSSYTRVFFSLPCDLMCIVNICSLFLGYWTSKMWWKFIEVFKFFHFEVPNQLLANWSIILLITCNIKRSKHFAGLYAW